MSIGPKSRRCSHCHGIVRNGTDAKGREKRYSLEALTALHDESCPGLNRGKGVKR